MILVVHADILLLDYASACRPGVKDTTGLHRFDGRGFERVRAPLPLQPACRQALVGSSSSPFELGLCQLDVETQRAHFLDEHVEGSPECRPRTCRHPNDRLVDLGPACNVIRLHGQHFLKRVGGAISLQRPNLHFTEALATELRLTTQRLLGHKRVRTDRTGVDLVIHQSGEA